MDSKDTKIEGLDEAASSVAIAINEHLTRNNILAGMKSGQLRGNAEDLFKAIVSIIADAAIYSHIPAVKALEDQIEWLNEQLSNAYDNVTVHEAPAGMVMMPEDTPQRIATLEAQLAGGEAVAWGLFWKNEDGTEVLQFPVGAKEQDCRDDMKMYSPAVQASLSIRPLISAPAIKQQVAEKVKDLMKVYDYLSESTEHAHEDGTVRCGTDAMRDVLQVIDQVIAASATPTHPVSANQPDSPSEYKAAAEFIAQFRHEYPAAEWLSKALLYKFNQTQVHPGDKPDGGKVQAYAVIVDGRFHDVKRFENDAKESGFETGQRFDLLPLIAASPSAPIAEQVGWGAGIARAGDEFRDSILHETGPLEINDILHRFDATIGEFLFVPKASAESGG